MTEKLSEKKEDFKEALLLIENMIESDKIQRFNFSIKETTALLFVTELLAAHIAEIQTN